MNIQELLLMAVTRNASDLHLLSSHLPMLRVNGLLRPLVTLSEVSTADIETMVFSLLTPQQKELLVTNKELDFSTTITRQDGITVRFRANAYFQQGTLSVCFRVIPTKILSVEELGLPRIMSEFAKLRQGFVLVTGPTGHGKSTTLAAVISEINEARADHVITIEDPVEYVFPKGKSIISQREMYHDTNSWRGALKSVLREDPDVVYIGEMRDAETVGSAITIAETGHLVFSTLHTNSAAQSIDRIIDTFPAAQQTQIRMQLSLVLSGIVTQRLIPTVTGNRTPACEILLGTLPVRNLIREGKTYLLDNTIQTSSDSGMMLFEENLRQLVLNNTITHETALEYALRPDIYLQLTKR